MTSKLARSADEAYQDTGLGDTSLYGPAAGYRAGHHRHSEFTRAAAEALGTFIVVLAIMLSLMFTMLSGNSWLVIALTVGMAITAAMASAGRVSGGGDFNPAVTLGKAIAGRTAWSNVLPYIAGQIVGAAAAALVVWAIIPETFAQAINFASRGAFIATTAPGYGPLSPLSQASGGQTEFGLGVALLAEVLFTALFVGVVIGSTGKRARRSGTAPLAVGMAFAAFWMMTWPISRGGMNPVRAFASVMLAFDTDLWRQLWLFILGPLLGAILAGVVYRAFQPAGALTEASGSSSPVRRPASRGYADTMVDADTYTVEDVADPVLFANEPLLTDDAALTPASDGAVAEELLVSEPRDVFVVNESEVDEGGDAIISGDAAEVAADILEADRNAE